MTKVCTLNADFFGFGFDQPVTIVIEPSTSRYIRVRATLMTVTRSTKLERSEAQELGLALLAVLKETGETPPGL